VFGFWATPKNKRYPFRVVVRGLDPRIQGQRPQHDHRRRRVDVRSRPGMTGGGCDSVVSRRRWADDKKRDAAEVRKEIEAILQEKVSAVSAPWGGPDRREADRRARRESLVARALRDPA
jgi:hypothetical protein